MNYLDQSINSIRLFLIEKSPNLEQFRMLAQNSFVWNGNIVNYGILGESHFVHLDNGGHEITEICACTHGDFGEQSKVVVASRLHELKTLPLTHTWGRYNYTFNFRYVDYARGMELLTDLRNLKLKSNTRYIQYEFPPRFFFGKSAFTEVFIRNTEHNMFIRSIHTYPNNQKVAVTESSFKIHNAHEHHALDEQYAREPKTIGTYEYLHKDLSENTDTL